MRKDYRLAIRTSQEVYEKLKERAFLNRSDSVSQEARIILEKELGIKRQKKERPN